MMQALGGSRLLYRIRRDRGRTQDELSRDSGVSARTIRGLERGEIRTPQSATLQQLADALHLSPREQAEFIRAWASPARPSLLQLLLDPSLTELEQVDALTRPTLGAYRVISQFWHTTIGADGRMSRTRCDNAIQAIEDDLERVFNVQNGDDSTRTSRMQFLPLRGSSLENRWDFEESNVSVFAVRLPRALARGERHVYTYEILGDPDEGGALGPSDGFIWGAPHTTRSIIVSVDFETRPAALRRVALRPGKRIQVLEEVTLDRDNHTAFVLEDAGPGAHGFTWHW